MASRDAFTIPILRIFYNFSLNGNELGRVRAPIGLAINAESPEEIAVSIVAKLIKVRAEGGLSFTLSHKL
jgi:xanthine/CO dehydrogenase XdhC/CoxF family maturation factor